MKCMFTIEEVVHPQEKAPRLPSCELGPLRPELESIMFQELKVSTMATQASYLTVYIASEAGSSAIVKLGWELLGQ
jgi:hypothetical protein